VPPHCYRMRANDRDLIRGGHYGQRSCEPHRKAEHMAAPTNAANREESSCQLGAVHTWHEPSVLAPLGLVRKLGLSCRVPHAGVDLPQWKGDLPSPTRRLHGSP
jgi:hypothetical protein